VSSEYRAVAERAMHRCEYCQAPEALANFPFFVDHIVPRARAKDLIDNPDNLALACPPCNLHKADRVDAVDPETGNRVRLFHPRRDTWDDHFAWSDDQVTLLGLTAIGRMTIVALQLNRPEQRRARAFWLSSNQFP
jgi:hypothetical protein